ncbi:hypothetical protein GCM10010519_36410 [Streptomyces lactacystinicus]
MRRDMPRIVRSDRPRCQMAAREADADRRVGESSEQLDHPRNHLGEEIGRGKEVDRDFDALVEFPVPGRAGFGVRRHASNLVYRDVSNTGPGKALPSDTWRDPAGREWCNVLRGITEKGGNTCKMVERSPT